MTIQTHAADRKAMAHALANELQVQVRYLGMPSCGYQVGQYTVNRDASISGDDLEPIRGFLSHHGYIDDDSETDQDSTEQTEAVTQVPSGTHISIPLAELTPTMAINLIRLVYSRQDLIAAMTQDQGIFVDEEVIDLLHDEKDQSLRKIAELLRMETVAGMLRGITITENHLTMNFPYQEGQPTNWVHYSRLMTAMVDRAKQAHRIQGKPLHPAENEMKYWCYLFLMQLGFGGPDYKETRRILLGHLKGYAAFKNAAQMDAHKSKCAERRRAAREAAAQEDGEAGSHVS